MPNNSSSLSINHSDLRILLWDLDGTLVRGRRLGSFKDYTVPMLQSVFGTAGCLPDLVVSGMTDLQIVEEALRGEGITREHINSRKTQLKESYIREMRRSVGEGAHVIEAMPGAHEVLQAVDEHPRYLSALLTGNIEPAAHLKVEVAGLAKFFTLPGAFGDESFDRRDLPEKAVERINRRLDLHLPPEQFIVIGDTPNDVACARHYGTRVLAVGTGRIHSLEQLLACEPDAFVPDLRDVELFMNTLAKL